MHATGEYARYKELVAFVGRKGCVNQDHDS